MNQACRGVRERLLDGESREASSAHLDSCEACARFAARMEAARELLDKRSHHQPDAFFAQRVVAALPEGQDVLGWAALRVLPATLAAALVLSVWCWLATPVPSQLVEQSPTDDLLAWVIEEDGS
jgi:anti-sigma factor RsiW